jgi:hypothetical protein
MRRPMMIGLGAAVLVVGLACSDDENPLDPGPPDPGPPGTPGMRFLAGEGGIDSIEAEPDQALVFELIGADGEPTPGLVVRFTSVDAVPESPELGVSMLVGSLNGASFGTLVAERTDERGRAGVRVQFGRRAGPGKIRVTVPELGETITANFTVVPGNAATVKAFPRDTMLMVGRSITLRSAVTDRFDNPRNDPVTLMRLDGPVTLAGTSVTGTAFGVGRVQVSALGVTDISTISVVPTGTLAAGGSQGIVTFELDGSNRRTITPMGAQNVRWAPDGLALAFDQGFSTPARVVTLTGQVRPVTQQSIGSRAEMYPAFTRDGGTVYFSAVPPGGPEEFRLMRATSAGASPVLVNTLSPEDDFFPSPSPDGTRLAYVRRTGGGEDFIRILTVASGVVNKIDVPGHAPAWSPIGDRIAYVDLRAGAVLKTMLPDGSDRRQITVTTGFEKGVQWSPDGQYLVGYNDATGRIHVVSVATGLMVALPGTQGLRSPTWKP